MLLPFTLLEIDDTVRSFEAMPSAVNTADSGDRVPLRILGVGLADGIESRPTSVDLIRKDQVTVEEMSDKIDIPLMSVGLLNSEQGALGGSCLRP